LTKAGAGRFELAAANTYQNNAPGNTITDVNDTAQSTIPTVWSPTNGIAADPGGPGNRGKSADGRGRIDRDADGFAGADSVGIDDGDVNAGRAGRG
jgi:hypothetical protein